MHEDDQHLMGKKYFERVTKDFDLSEEDQAMLSDMLDDEQEAFESQILDGIDPLDII